jgi:nucleoside-diphosphate-sugar epimerase
MLSCLVVARWCAPVPLQVHVRDVVAAIWHVLQRTDPAGTVFNIADKGASGKLFLVATYA